MHLEEAIGWLEKSFDELPPPSRAGWEELWDAARAVLSGGAETASLGLTGLTHAVLALADKLVSPGWYRLARALAAREVGRDEPDLRVIVRVE